MARSEEVAHPRLIGPDGTAYAARGPVDRPVAILIHGIGLHRGIWDDIARSLASEHRIISYDLYGHGESEPAPRAIDLTLLADQLVGLLDHLAIDRATLIGFSLGGMINRRVAIDHPDRVAALAILNSPHERSAEAQQLVEERAAATETGDLAATLDTTLARWFTPSAPPVLVEQVRACILANDLATFAEVRNVLAAGVTELIRPDPPITAPTLVVTCEHDSGSTPEMAHAIAAEIAGSAVAVVPGLQHLGLLEDASPFVDLLRTLLNRVEIEDRRLGLITSNSTQQPGGNTADDGGGGDVADDNRTGADH